MTVGAAVKIPGINLSDTTIDNVRKRNGIAFAPEREKIVDASRFLNAGWEGLLAADSSKPYRLQNGLSERKEPSDHRSRYEVYREIQNNAG